jgi:hypothetical protein
MARDIRLGRIAEFIRKFLPLRSMPYAKLVSAAALRLDVKGYVDSIDWELLLKAVRHHRRTMRVTERNPTVM